MGEKGIHSHRNTAGVEPSIKNKNKNKKKWLHRPDLSDHAYSKIFGMVSPNEKHNH